MGVVSWPAMAMVAMGVAVGVAVGVGLAGAGAWVLVVQWAHYCLGLPDRV